MDQDTDDEELIAAFKMWGPSTEYEGISKKMLIQTLKDEGETLSDKDAEFIFDYVDND